MSKLRRTSATVNDWFTRRSWRIMRSAGAFAYHGIGPSPRGAGRGALARLLAGRQAVGGRCF